MTASRLGQVGLIVTLLAMPAVGQAPDVAAPTNAPAASTTGLLDDLQSRAAKGDADAEQKLGMIYFDGQLVPKDQAHAFALVLQAAQQGNVTAGYNVAYMYINGVGTKKDPAAGFQWYLTFAKKGDARAEYFTGSLYLQGLGTTKDLAQAFIWLQKAALQGDAQSENDLGVCYEYGYGVAKDPKLALDWYTKSANQGFALAQLTVGKMYFYGHGTAKDEAQGVAWFEKAAIQGNTEAYTLLGVACLKGTGTPVDVKKGFTYLLSSSLTDAYATYWIAWCYSSGTFVTKDLVQAYTWGLRASTMTTRDEVTKFLADLKPKLTADQIATAQKGVPELNLLFHGFIQPGDTGATFATGKSSVIPYVDATGMILLPIATQDNTRAYLMFDTGASSSFLSQDYATKAGLKGNSYIPVSGIGQNLELGLVSDKSDFSLPGMTFKNVRWAIGSHFIFDTDVGEPIVGVLGTDITKNFVVRINYSNHTLEFIDPGAFTPKDSDGPALPITVDASWPFVHASLIQDGVEGTGSFLIDTGNNAYIDVAKNFQDENPALKLHGIAASAASGIGGNSYSAIGTCSTFVLGGFALPKAEIDIERSNQGVLEGESGTIGNKIWRRFNVCLDFPGRKIYLQKNAHFDEPYNYATAGMHITAAPPDYTTLTVREILPGSDGARAGFQTGDVITAVQELGQEPLRMDNLYPVFHTVGTAHVVVQREGKAVPLVLVITDPLAGDAAAKP